MSEVGMLVFFLSILLVGLGIFVIILKTNEESKLALWSITNAQVVKISTEHKRETRGNGVNYGLIDFLNVSSSSFSTTENNYYRVCVIYKFETIDDGKCVIGSWKGIWKSRTDCDMEILNRFDNCSGILIKYNPSSPQDQNQLL